MKIPGLKGLAASAVALATVALPLQAMAAPHARAGLDPARCQQIQSVEGQYQWLARQYPQLQQWIMQCAGMAGPAAPSGPAAQLQAFSDLDGYGWAADDIDLLQSMGIMQGVGADLFRPAGILSRVQFAALLQRVFHLTVPSNPISFVDVPTGYWGYDAVEAAAPYMGEFNTPGGVAFEPNLPMLRIDVAATIGKILVSENLAQLPTAAEAASVWGGFADGSLVPAGLSQYAAVAVQAGIMTGYANGKFGVDDTLNRAQAAVLLVRVLEGTESMPGGTGSIGSTSSVQGTFQSASGTALNLTVNGSAEQFTLSPSGVTVTLNGAASSLGSLTAGDEVTLTLNASGQVIAVAATGTGTGVATLSGTVSSVNGNTLVISVNGTDIQLTAAPGVTLTVVPGETVTVSVNASGQIVSVTVTGTTTSSATGTVVSVTSGDIELAVNGSDITYPIAAGATVTLNGASVPIGSLAAGDSATVTINASGQVTNIAATGSSATTSETGTLVAINTGASTIELSINGTNQTFTVVAGATITVNGQAAGLGELSAGETAAITIDSAGQVTAISVSAPTVASTVTGYIVATSATNVAVAVYENNGVAQSAHAIDAGAQITLNGSASSAASLPLGDAATVGLDSNGGVASIAATTPSGQVTGELVGITATQASVFVNGSVQYIALGSAPVAFSGGSEIGVTSLPLDTTITIDPSAINGSALLVH
jgi:hypothetical protein